MWNVKEVNIVSTKGLYIVLIETLWNVKYLSYSKCRNVSREVLIETLWNVKTLFTEFCELHENLVLIETLWNVKTSLRYIGNGEWAY